jgi:hypothetical protein
VPAVHFSPEKTTQPRCVRKLDAIVRNKYANNAAVLAEWTSASHNRTSTETGETAATAGDAHDVKARAG